MLHFIELRHNPLALPSRTTPDAFIGASELIFIASENDYTLNHKFESAQFIRPEVFRCIADDNAKRRLIGCLIATLPETDELVKALKAYAETLNEPGTKKK